MTNIQTAENIQLDSLSESNGRGFTRNTPGALVLQGSITAVERPPRVSVCYNRPGWNQGVPQVAEYIPTPDFEAAIATVQDDVLAAESIAKVIDKNRD